MLNLFGFTEMHQVQDAGLLTEPGNFDACLWFGLECDQQNVVIRISWPATALTDFGMNHLKNFVNLYISWLPQTLCEIDMSGLHIDSTFETRMLPRALINGKFENCALLGSVNCETLPEKLARLSLHKNYFSGSVVLQNLPKGLRALDICHNRITQVWIDKEGLPQNLDYISLLNPSSRIDFFRFGRKKVSQCVRTVEQGRVAKITNHGLIQA